MVGRLSPASFWVSAYFQGLKLLVLGSLPGSHILVGTKKYKIYGHFEGFPLQQRSYFPKEKIRKCVISKKNWVDGHQPNFL